MPMDRTRYPADWKAISQHQRRFVAGNRCQWCGVPNGEIGARDKAGVWRSAHAIDCLNSDAGEELYGDYPTMIRIVLTVAHIQNPDPMDCRPENLAALCQRCHNRHDAKDRAAHAAETRKRKRLALQPALLEVL